MYAGQTVEAGPDARGARRSARTPTRACCSPAIPTAPTSSPASPALVPSPLAPPPGCRFHAALPAGAPSVLQRRPPALVAASAPGHAVACVSPTSAQGRARMSAGASPSSRRATSSYRARRRTRVPRQAVPPVRAVGRRHARARGRRDAGAGRRVRLRQDHARRARCSASSARPPATIRLDGAVVSGLEPREARRIRRAVQYVHQDAGAALDPWWSIGRILDEALRIHGVARPRRARARQIDAILAAVGLDASFRPPLPARAVGRPAAPRGAGAHPRCCEPRIVILDEPTSGLDLSVQATVLSLIADLQARFGLTYLFISPRPLGGRAHVRPRRHHVSRPHRRGRAGARHLRRARAIPTRARCWPPRRGSSPAASSAAACSRASRRARASCPRAAPSARAARTPRRRAPIRCRRWSPSPTATTSPACAGGRSRSTRIAPSPHLFRWGEGRGEGRTTYAPQAALACRLA